MPPPPAESAVTRLFAGPALRTQSDRRLVTLVREGYEVAFEEIVRRYGRALGRYAAAIVGSRSEDVTQDAFSKALQALRRADGAEIELRPWLYRIVRNTALNDLRDRPPVADVLEEAIEGGSLSASEEAERREEISELMTRLRALPEPQRAAIVMRELEGLSHEEIAAALGLSGGAARQAIHRARTALRNGLGMMIPLPLLRLLIDHGAEVAGAGAGGTAAVAAGAATAGGAGAGGALKLGAVAALVAGTVGTGLVVEHRNQRDQSASAADSPVREVSSVAPSSVTPSPSSSSGTASLAGSTEAGEDRHRGNSEEEGDDRGRHGEAGHGDHFGGNGRGPSGSSHFDDSGPGGRGPLGPHGLHGQGGRGGRGPGHGEEGPPGENHSGPGQGQRQGPRGGGSSDQGAGAPPPPPAGGGGSQGPGGGPGPNGAPDQGSGGDSGSGHSGSGGGSSNEGFDPSSGSSDGDDGLSEISP